MGWWFFGSSHTSTDDLTAPPDNDMVDDTVGALTRSVYNSTSNTSTALHKMESTLKDFQSSNDRYTTFLRKLSSQFSTSLKFSKLVSNNALNQSLRAENGISDSASANVIDKFVKSMAKSNEYLIRATEQKNALRDLIDISNKKISQLGSNIFGNSHRSNSVMAVANHICANAKLMQGMSKSIVQKAERYHLAKAAPEFENAVTNLKDMLKIEGKFLPLKSVSPNDVIPRSFDTKLDSMYTHNNRAIEHASKALLFSGPARAREIVSAREEIRSGINDAQDVLDTTRAVTDKIIGRQIIAKAMNANRVIAGELLPSISKFYEINEKISKIIDPNDAIRIDRNLTKQMVKQNGIDLSSFTVVLPQRRFIYNEFL